MKTTSHFRRLASLFHTKSHRSGRRSTNRVGSLSSSTHTLELLEDRRLLAVFSSSVTIDIPGTGDSGPANPYPSTINVPSNGVQSQIVDLNVDLSGLTHTYPDDIDVMLEGPDGTNVVIMSDVGLGDDVSSINLTLDDEAATGLPDDGPLVSGSFQPTNIGTGDTFDAPAPTTSANVALASFDGTSPSGTWNLWIDDDVGGDSGTLSGWSLNMVLGGDVVVHAGPAADDGTDDTFEIRLTGGTTLEIEVNNVVVFSEPFAGITSLTINGSGDNDTLIVDNSGGNPIPAGGISFDGGGQTGAPGDRLEVQGGNFATVESNYDNATDGNVDLDGSTITYTGLEPVLINVGTAADVIFNLPAAADDATLEDDAGAVAGLSQLTSNNGTFETTTFTNPTNSLTVNADDGQDILSLVALDAGWSAPTINLFGEGGTDQVRIGATPAGTTVNVDTGVGVPGDLLLLGAITGSGGAQATPFAQFNTGVSTLDFLMGTVNFDDVGGVGELFVDGSGDTIADNVTFTASSITGAAPAAVNYVGPNVNMVQLALGAGADTVNVNSTGADDFDNGGTAIFSNGGNDSFVIAADTLSSNNTFDGGDDNDLFTVDFPAGTTLGQNAQGYAPFISLQIDGGSQSASPGDRLEILATTGFTTVTSNYTNANDGDVDLDGSTITYTGLEPVLINVGTIADVIFNLPGTADDATLEDDTGAIAGLSQLTSNNGTFETTTFTNPTNSLTINAAGGDDTLTVDLLDGAFAAALVLNGDGDTDEFTVNADPGNGAVLNAETVNLNADITGTVTGNATTVNVASPASIQDGVDAAASGGTVNIRSGVYNDVLDTTSKNLVVTIGASPGQVTVNGMTTNGLDTLEFEMDGTAGPGVPGGHDQIVVNGNVILNLATLDLTLSATPAEGEQFVLIDNDGIDPVQGTFAGLPEGATFPAGGTTFRITYAGGTGNEVVLTVDNNQPPLVVDIMVSDGLITDADAGPGNFEVTVEYNEAMDTAVAPLITFDPAVASTLAFDSGTWSGGGTIYTAVYDVVDAGVEASLVDVLVAGGEDLAGNVQVPASEADAFDVDTLNPTATSVTPSNTSVDQSDVGLGNFQVTVVYSEPMDTGIDPTVSFDPLVGSTLSFAGGAWSGGGTVFTATYNVADANVEVSGVDILVDGGEDVAGNAVVPATEVDAFSIDTVIPIITSITPSDTFITDADVGAGNFQVTVVFSEPMNTGIAPSITFTPSVASTLSFASGGWSAGNTTYTATYNVIDSAVEVAGVDISVAGGQDTGGNPPAPLTVVDQFSVDTLIAGTVSVFPTTVLEGEGVTLDGTFVDSVQDHTVTVTWGDGHTSILNLPPGDSDFTLTHGYLDDMPSGTAQDTYSIVVTVTDAQGEVFTDTSLSVLVENGSPIIMSLAITPTSITSGAQATISGTYTEPGILDPVVADVDLDSDGTYDVTDIPVSGGSFSFDVTYDLPPGMYTTNVRLRDDDSGTSTFATAVTVTPALNTAVLNSQVFYNNSAFDGGDAAGNAADLNAVDTSKSSLGIGQAATFGNITGSNAGITGILFTVNTLPSDGAGLSAADFQVRLGATNNINSWAAGPSPTATVLANAGPGGADYVLLTFPADSIEDTYAAFQMLANANTGLASAHTAIFGNVQGETGAAFVGQGSFFGRDAADLQAMVPALFLPAGVTSSTDVTKDGTTNAFDLQVIPVESTLAIGGAFQSNVIPVITPAFASVPAPGFAAAAFDQAVADEDTVEQAASLPPGALPTVDGSTNSNQDGRTGDTTANGDDNRDLAFATFGASEGAENDLIGALATGRMSL